MDRAHFSTVFFDVKRLEKTALELFEIFMKLMGYGA
jgi:hypothetical protein